MTLFFLISSSINCLQDRVLVKISKIYWLKNGQKESLSTEERAQIVTSSNLKFSLRRIAKKMKVNKTAVHDAIMKYQNEGVFKDRKRSGRPRVTTSSEDRLMREAVTHSSMSTSKKIQAKLMETGTAVTTKTIHRKFSMEFGLKSCKLAQKPRLAQAMKKKRLDFA